MRLGAIEQKIFGHSAMRNVVRIPLLRKNGKNKEMDIEEVPIAAEVKRQTVSRAQQKIKVSKME